MNTHGTDEKGQWMAEPIGVGIVRFYRRAAERPYYNASGKHWTESRWVQVGYKRGDIFSRTLRGLKAKLKAARDQ